MSSARRAPEVAVRSGLDLTVLNRGRATTRRLPDAVRRLEADVHDRESLLTALGDEEYDAVVHWVAFDPEDVEAAVEVFRGRTRQLVLISSASAYETPPRRLPVTEATPLRNPTGSTRAARSPARRCSSGPTARTGSR